VAGNLEQDLVGASGHGSPVPSSWRERAATRSEENHGGVFRTFLRKLSATFCISIFISYFFEPGVEAAGLDPEYEKVIRGS